MPLPHDYSERVYAGVLGKIIGVYLGRPFESWSYERIMAELGEISYYVHGRQEASIKNRLLIVTDGSNPLTSNEKNQHLGEMVSLQYGDELNQDGTGTIDARPAAAA